MVPLRELAIPIVLSAVFVFLASSIIHMALTFWHRGDLEKLPDEDRVMDALRPFGLRPGNYAMPLAYGMADMKNPAFIEKMKKGPVAFLTVGPSGPPTMGKQLLLWFAYSIAVSTLCAGIAGALLHRGDHSHEIFHTVALSAFGCYGMGLLQESIWWRRKWSATIKSAIDGLIYAVITGLTFVWLWPAAM